MSLPFEINDVPDSVNEELWSAFPGNDEKYVHAGPGKHLLCSGYKEEAAAIYNLQLRSDDVWVVTFPRSGTTWAQELLWLINNDLDYERAMKEKLKYRFPFIEGNTFISKRYISDLVELNKMDSKQEEEFRNSFDKVSQRIMRMESPRHIKTHLPLSLLPPKLLDTCKVVYVARNPKDVAVSCFYQNSFLTIFGFHENFAKYWDLFQRGQVLWAPFWTHVQEAWRLRNHPNMLYLFYEDMKKDLPSTLHKVAAFLNKTLNEEQVAKLVDHLKIENFKKNTSIYDQSGLVKGFVNTDQPGFIRQGKSGSWRNEFTPELNAKADEWIKENEELTDLRFQY